MLRYLQTAYLRLVVIRRPRPDAAGFATAELLGNAALGVAALVVIWAGLRALGLDIITWIHGQVMG